MRRVRSDRRLVPEHGFDLGDRRAMLPAFRRVAGIPIATGNRPVMVLAWSLYRRSSIAMIGVATPIGVATRRQEQDAKYLLTDYS
jgi:hypothetical protein